MEHIELCEYAQESCRDDDFEDVDVCEMYSSVLRNSSVDVCEMYSSFLRNSSVDVVIFF